MSGLERALAEAICPKVCGPYEHICGEVADAALPVLRKQGVVMFADREAFTREVAEGLGEHGYDGGWRCGCGWTGTWSEWLEHTAAALVTRLLGEGGG